MYIPVNESPKNWPESKRKQIKVDLKKLTDCWADEFL